MIKVRIKYKNEEESKELVSLLKRNYDILDEKELPDFRSRSEYLNTYLVLEKKNIDDLKND